MNKGHLVDRIASSSKCSKTQAAAAIDTMIDGVTAALKKGERVTLVGFGTFSVSQRKARNGRNPQTGSLIKIAARKVAKFTPGIDRMLDMGFIRDIRRILALLPAKRQNLLFSATFSDEIRKLADSLLHDPAQVEVARRNAESALVSQRVHPVEQTRKRELLAHLVESGNWQQVLVFCRTKHGANRLAQQLSREGLEADAIHGNKSQPQRVRALAGFKNGTVRVLVATDIAARGLDIVELPHVVNFDLPHVPEDYVHRIGRTGRAGVTGEAISLVSAEDQPLLSAIERLLGRKLDRQVIAGFEVSAGAARAASPTTREADRRDNRGNTSRPQQQRDPRGSRPQGRAQDARAKRAGDRARNGNAAGKPASHSRAASSPAQGAGRRAPANRHGGNRKSEPALLGSGARGVDR